MNYFLFSKIILLFFPLVFVFSENLIALSADKKNTKSSCYQSTTYPKTIRVLIEEQTTKKPLIYLFGALTGETIVNQQLVFNAKSHGRIILLAGKFYCTQAQRKAWSFVHDTVVITSSDGHLLFNNKEYRGSLVLHYQADKNKLLIINELDIEDYVYSVVRSECIPYWPIEIQKVQAVISRSYALYHVCASRARNKLYDIKASTLHQVYEGHHRIKHLREAVHATRHQLLTYQGKPALTMFDICCGGIIPAQRGLVDPTKPYLFRPNRCTYCRQSSYYQWRKSFLYRDFLKALKKEKSMRDKLISVGVKKEFSTQHHRSQVTERIIVQGSKKKVTFLPQEFKQAFVGQLRSPTFWFTRENEYIHIDGLGFGHHHGLCQCGAFYLVKAGWSYKKILRFYFPRTKLIRY